jgi:hypothetical protein
LLRIGRGHAGLIALLSLGLTTALLLAVGAAAPPVDFATYVAIVGLLVAGTVVLYGVTCVMT